MIFHNFRKLLYAMLVPKYSNLSSICSSFYWAFPVEPVEPYPILTIICCTFCFGTVAILKKICHKSLRISYKQKYVLLDNPEILDKHKFPQPDVNKTRINLPKILNYFNGKSNLIFNIKYCRIITCYLQKFNNFANNFSHLLYYHLSI